MKNRSKTPLISFETLLAVAFIVLKLTNVIDWSWWWVLAPIWIPIAIVLIILAVTLLTVGKML